MAKKKDNLTDAKPADLNKKLETLREELGTMKFKAEGAKTKNVKEASRIKKEIARILTQVRKNNINTK